MHSVNVNGREVPVVSPRLSLSDRVGGWKMRWNLGRDRYTVAPGLYAVGAPSLESPVLVTANYKLTFDKVRAECQGLDAWILVLDTRGVNVWCAAGKGTFSTRELEQRLLAVRLDQVVSHRTLILPQLGATGVSGPSVLKDTGWRIIFGPVRARDIRAFLANGMKKDNGMRKVEFGLRDRLAVAPVELVQAWPFLLGTAAASALLALPFGPGYLHRLLALCVPLVGAVLVGTVGVPGASPRHSVSRFLPQGRHPRRALGPCRLPGVQGEHGGRVRVRACRCFPGGFPGDELHGRNHIHVPGRGGA